MIGLTLSKRYRLLLATCGTIILFALIAPKIYKELLTNEPLPRFIDLATVADDIIGTQSTMDLTGRWVLTPPSEVGYRVKERIVITDLEAVGRTQSIDGELTVNNLEIFSGSFEVDMRTLKSDKSQRDAQFNGRIMKTTEFPKASFALKHPIELSRLPTEQQALITTARGFLTLRGTTKEVTFFVRSQVKNSYINVTGQIEITFSEWGIPNPSVPEVFIYTKPQGLLEFNLIFKKVAE